MWKKMHPIKPNTRKFSVLKEKEKEKKIQPPNKLRN